MNLDHVYAQFALFAGLPQDQKEKWLPLCEAAIAKIRGMLLPDANEMDSRLTLAAAGEVYYQYALMHNGGNIQSVKVGEISVSEGIGGAVDGVRTLRDELLANTAGLLECRFAGLRQVF